MRTSSDTCPRCGTRSVAALEGLCAACLLQQALQPMDDLAEDPQQRYRVVTVFDAGPSHTTYLAEQAPPGERYVLLTLYGRGGDARPRVTAGAPREIERGVTPDGRVFVVTEYSGRERRER